MRSSYPQTLDGFVQACVPEMDSEHIKRWGRQILDRSSPDAAVALHRMTRTVDLRPDIPRITQPALLLHGDADRLVPLESSRWLAQALPNARLVVLPGAGHVPSMTRPVDVAREMAAFMRDMKMAQD